MGTSTNGILVFGFEVGDEDQAPSFLDGYEDFEEYLEDISGLPKWGEPGHSWDEQRSFREQCPVDLVTHCHHDCRMYILAVRGTEHVAHRGFPKEINLADLDVSTEKIAALKEWAAKRDLKGEPAWLLCSMWS